MKLILWSSFLVRELLLITISLNHPPVRLGDKIDYFIIYIVFLGFTSQKYLENYSYKEYQPKIKFF